MFILDFSSDRTLAAVARRKDHTVVVLDLKSGVPRLTIEANMEVHGLRLIGNAVVVIGDQKVITWNLPEGDCVPGARANLEGSAQAIQLSGPQEGKTFYATMSPDLRYIALATSPSMMSNHLYIYRASTGEYLGHESQWAPALWFAPNGCDLYVYDGNDARVWRVGGGENGLEYLRHEVDTEHPPEGWPWASSRGYQVTDDCQWVLGPDGQRLLMLPLPCHNVLVTGRVWAGQFLAFLQGGVSEPLILELEVGP